MFLGRLLTILAISAATLALQTYHIDDICLHNTTIHLTTQTVFFNVDTDFTNFTTCDVDLQFMGKDMTAVVYVLPHGALITECGWMSFVRGAPLKTIDVCEDNRTSWVLNQGGTIDRTTIHLDGTVWMHSAISVPMVNYTLAIYGYYWRCEQKTDLCKNTKEDCVYDDCDSEEGRARCSLYCHTCSGKLTCCDDYGETGENTDTHMCNGKFCIHKNMTCDNYTNCDDGSDEMCVVSGGVVVVVMWGMATFGVVWVV